MKAELTVEAALIELEEVAKAVLEFASNCAVIAFYGDLGAGKTSLIKNICNLLHVKDEVNSPTFSLVNEYLTEGNQKVFHFDFYRLLIEEEALDMGCEDYFESGSRCFIEWPENIPSLLPLSRIEVYISISGSERRYNLKRIQ